MSIDIDRGFKKISELRFYEIKNTRRQENIPQAKKPQNGEEKPHSPIKKMTPEQKREILRIMQERLIQGEIIKVILSDSGFHPWAGMRFFKRHTGVTMKQYRILHTLQK